MIRLGFMRLSVPAFLSLFSLPAFGQGQQEEEPPPPEAVKVPAHEPGPAAEPAPAPKTPDTPAPASAPEPAHPGRASVVVGVELTGLSRFEIGPATFNAEFLAAFHCKSGPCAMDFDVVNGKITGKELILDQGEVKVYQVKAELTGFVDLKNFPFDSHVLPIELIQKENPESVTYEASTEGLAVDPSVRLAGWEIGKTASASIEMQRFGDNDEYAFTIYEYKVTISRPTLSAFGKSIMPVLFMVLVVVLTLFLRKGAMNRMQLQATGLTGVVMFHISATSSLPQLGYMTRMDKFMVATYALYVVALAFSLIIVYCDERKKEAIADQAYRAANIAVPAFAMVAWGLVALKVV